MILMTRIFITVLLVIPTLGFSQFNQSEFYATARMAFGMGMNSYTYRTVLDGASVEQPKTVQLDLGSGMSPEIALGFKLTDYVYIETSLSYTLNQDFYTTHSGNQTNEQGYSFKRFNIQLNGKYFEEITESFLLDFSGGMAFSMPQELLVKVSGTTESIDYAGGVGIQAGFGANYRVSDFNFNGGIRYRLERFTIKPNQNLPQSFNGINPNFDQISSSGIDVVFAVQYNF